jgi:UDP-N-acetylmuramate--alanine ligase
MEKDLKFYPNKKNTLPKDEILGVIGICGVVGNLMARVLLDQGYQVIGTDIHSQDNCDYIYTLKKYDLPVYLGSHPDIFFESAKSIIPPPSLPEDSELFQKIKQSKAEILDVNDILSIFPPNKPVITITGTNGKTTSTQLLFHIAQQSGMIPTDHGFKSLQGNKEYMPSLQARLKGDVAVLEVGSTGRSGDLKFAIGRCQPNCGLLTNINPDHLDEEQDFLHYARIKGELMEVLMDKKLVINTDDPTVWGLIEQVEYQGEVSKFGVKVATSKKSNKMCWCGEELEIEETISGMGYYNCECGLSQPEPDYYAYDIKENSFMLHTPQGNHEILLQIKGLHNVYNALGSIVVAIEFLNIPIEDVKSAVKSFKGVEGRLEYIQNYNGKDIIVDYAHNPSGVETVLQELAKKYPRMAVVITISSESGIKGDEEILLRSYNMADYTIPASFYSNKAAEKYMSSKKIILTEVKPSEFRQGTLGATPEQVMEGFKIALDCDVDAIILLGEAAFKSKEIIFDYLNQIKITEKNKKNMGEQDVH